jgi:succinate dehydrogenase / fumarate reductase, cytochrome b subunit
VKDVREALMVARNSDGKLVRRPLSPHLQIYRFPLAQVLSILHRLAGVALSAGTLLMVWWLVAAATGENAFATVQGFVGSPFGWLLLFGWTVALFFHFFNGLRHLAWDVGRGFEKHEYTATGWAVVIATGAATVLVWVIFLAVR